MEAARVLEDLARFVVEDRDLSEGFKSIRHELVEIVDRLCGPDRAIHRDVAGDPGTSIEGACESSRASLFAVGVANGSRLAEALRTLEEGAKLGAHADDPKHAKALEGLRYRAYDLVAQLSTRLRSTQSHQWKVCLLLTRALCHHPWQAVLRSAIEGGLDAVQVREKDGTTAQLVAHARAVVAIAQPHGVSVIVNDRVDVALAAGADGVHLGIDDLSISDARAISNRPLLIGATVHDEGEAQRAIEAGADSCGVGAMFTTAVKPAQVPAGPRWMSEFLARWPQIPHLGVGGITPDNVAALAAVGCHGVAVSTCVCASDDPAEIVAALRERLP